MQRSITGMRMQHECSRRGVSALPYKQVGSSNNGNLDEGNIRKLTRQLLAIQLADELLAENLLHMLHV